MGQFDQLAGLAGLGQGLAQGTNTALAFYAQMREQNQRFRLGMNRLALGVKQLEEERRQADLTHRRFYDGLRHQDLMQTRDIKARRRLQEMIHDFQFDQQTREFTFRHDEAILGHERALEIQQMLNDARIREAKIRVAPEHRRNQLVERAQDIGLVEDLTTSAQQFITTQLMTPDGKLSTESAEMRARLAGFVDNNGVGNVAAYMQSLHEEWSAGMRSRYGETDIPLPSFTEWQGLAHGVVLGDARGQKVFVDGMTNKFMEAVALNPMQQGGEIFYHAMSSDATLQFDADENGDLVPATDKTNAVVSVIGEMNNNYPKGNVSSQTIESWTAQSLMALYEQTGMAMVDIGDVKQNVSKEDRAMFEILFRDQTGMDFPMNLSGYSKSTLDATETLIKNSGSIYGRDVSSVGDMPEGTSASAARTLGTVQSRVAGSVVQSRQAFADAQHRGDLTGMMSEFAASSAEYTNTLRELEEMGMADRPAIKAQMTEWLSLLESMSISYTDTQKSFTGPGAGESAARAMESRYGVSGTTGAISEE